MSVTNGDTVRVHYTGTLDDGEQFDSSAGREPLEFTVGAGQVIPGFETAVLGLEPGGTATVTIAPDDAYGPRHEQLAQTVSKRDFAEEPLIGMMVNLTSPDGDHLPGEIVAIDGDDVTLDFNHPLAGKTLTFAVELVEIVPVG
ncbi:MAG: peptidylprolyl isomerase [Coriobacteriia bacterium]|nr:peptidylprolyl isomerase [Coriobacteriia bacterium]